MTGEIAGLPLVGGVFLKAPSTVTVLGPDQKELSLSAELSFASDASSLHLTLDYANGEWNVTGNLTLFPDSTPPLMFTMVGSYSQTVQLEYNM